VPVGRVGMIYIDDIYIYIRYFQ